MDHKAPRKINSKATFLKFLLGIALLGLSLDSLMACTLLMGYRESAKAPFINKAPDNNGFYNELFSAAAHRIDCSLKIIRKPKKRIFSNLEDGSVDFYPRMSFVKDRTRYIYFIDTGFESYSAGLSREHLPEVTDLKQLKGKNVIRSLGASNHVKAEWGVNSFEVPKLNIQKAIMMLERKSADFFIYDYQTLKYFITSNQIHGFKLHHSCCKDDILKYLGFSRKSKHYRETPNTRYDNTKELSPDNFPTQMVQGSTAALFEQALLHMKTSGTTQKLLDKYADKFD